MRTSTSNDTRRRGPYLLEPSFAGGHEPEVLRTAGVDAFDGRDQEQDATKIAWEPMVSFFRANEPNSANCAVVLALAGRLNEARSVQAEVVAKNIAAAVRGQPSSERFDGHGKCFVEIGDGKAGFGGGDFYAEPKPVVTVHAPGRRWHLAKVLFEKAWLYTRL